MKNINNSRGIALILELVIVALAVTVGILAYIHVQDAKKIAQNKSALNASQTQTQQTSQSPATASAPQAAAPIAKVKADSQTPAAGACPGPGTSSIVTVIESPDFVPNPRCTKVSANQKLQVTNQSGQSLLVTFGGKDFDLANGQSYTIDDTFGDYLETGVHDIHFTSSSSGEIWLQ